MVHISKIAKIGLKVGDRAHEKWHVVRFIWIREQHRTLDTNRVDSYILRRNRKVKFKSPNEREQQDFDSIQATRNKVLESNIDAILPPEGSARLTLKLKIENQYKLGGPRKMSSYLPKLQESIGQHLEYRPNAQV